MESFELELMKLTEAYLIEHNIPIKRRFTHEELEGAMARIREAIALQKPVPLPEPEPSYWDEKAKDRWEEFAHSDACSKAGVAE